jgi:hypothetical protein
MREYVRLLTVGTTMSVAVGAGVLAMTSTSQASTIGVDLSMSGSVVAGVASASTYKQVPFTFMIKNKSTTTAADISFNFSPIVNGTASDYSADYVCPLTTNHYDINPDSSSCEPGTLGPGKSSSAAIIVTPSGSSGQTVTVKACAQNLSGAPDPVSSNNCKTLSIKIA